MFDNQPQTADFTRATGLPVVAIRETRPNAVESPEAQATLERLKDQQTLFMLIRKNRIERFFGHPTIVQEAVRLYDEALDRMESGA